MRSPDPRTHGTGRTVGRHASPRPPLIAAIGVLAGVVMAATVAATSGAALVWLTGAEHPASG